MERMTAQDCPGLERWRMKRALRGLSSGERGKEGGRGWEREAERGSERGGTDDIDKYHR